MVKCNRTNNFAFPGNFKDATNFKIFQNEGAHRVGSQIFLIQTSKIDVFHKFIVDLSTI